MTSAEAARILGVKIDDDERKIKTAFRKLMRKHHPDVLQSEEVCKSRGTSKLEIRVKLYLRLNQELVSDNQASINLAIVEVLKEYDTLLAR